MIMSFFKKPLQVSEHDLNVVHLLIKKHCRPVDRRGINNTNKRKLLIGCRSNVEPAHITEVMGDSEVRK